MRDSQRKQNVLFVFSSFRKIFFEKMFSVFLPFIVLVFRRARGGVNLYSLVSLVVSYISLTDLQDYLFLRLLTSLNLPLVLMGI